MSKAYPKESICKKCQSKIFVWFSTKKSREYATDKKTPAANFHKCYPLEYSEPSESSEVLEIPEKRKPEPVKNSVEFTTAEVDFNFNRNFRTVELNISKSRKVTNETIVQLPQYENIDYFVSMKIAVDNPSVDINEKIKRTFFELDRRISEQIEQDRVRLSGL